MNKVAIFFLILFFIVVIGIGVMAVREELFLEGNANFQCATPQIPQDVTCPDSQTMKLVKGADECYTFACR